MPNDFTAREERLMQIFDAFVLRLFQHDDVKPDAPVFEHIIENSFVDVEAASDVAADNADLAATLCRRAHAWHEIAPELSEFLCSIGFDEIEKLSIVRGMDYTAELKARHPEMLRSSNLNESEVRE